ncbi:viperin family antiviral radical SAM protein [Streptomyces sp. NPDC002092]
MEVGTGLAPPIESVNFHLWQPCNMHCGFCFARFKDVRREVLPAGHLPARDALRVVKMLADFGFKKITFAGGEPFLCPWLDDLIEMAAECGMVTSVVTNGSLVEDLSDLAHLLDWIVVSVDSLGLRTLTELGRTTSGRPMTESAYRDLCGQAHEVGVRLKVNTVVTRVNMKEHLAPFIADVAPHRWKILQMLPIKGQNGGKANPFAISREEFANFVARNRWVSRRGVKVVPEENEDMVGSYAMLDPAGRFFDNISGSYSYSRSVLECGVSVALSQVRLDRAKYLARGGNYDWGRHSQSLVGQ